MYYTILQFGSSIAKSLVRSGSSSKITIIRFNVRYSCWAVCYFKRLSFFSFIVTDLSNTHSPAKFETKLSGVGVSLGAHESTTKGRLSPADSDRLPPRDHAGSQSDGAGARRIGAGDGRREDRECASQPRGPLPHEAIPGWNLPLSEPLAATPTRRPRRIDSDRRLAPDQSSASSQRPPARLAAGNDDSQGCRTLEARVQPTAAAPQGHPGAKGALLHPTLIPTTITLWLGLR
jgi:hypothetical protein